MCISPLMKSYASKQTTTEQMKFHFIKLYKSWKTSRQITIVNEAICHLYGTGGHSTPILGFHIVTHWFSHLFSLTSGPLRLLIIRQWPSFPLASEFLITALLCVLSLLPAPLLPAPHKNDAFMRLRARRVWSLRVLPAHPFQFQLHLSFFLFFSTF